MKIIKNNLATNRIWLGTCNSCNSVIEVEQYELTDVKNDRSFENCPVCKNIKTVLFAPTNRYNNS